MASWIRTTSPRSAARRKWAGREFRFKGVLSRETDYQTGQGFQEAREPRGPVFGEDSIEFINEPPYFVDVPGGLEESGDLTTGQLSLSAGRYDLTISEKAQQNTGFGAFGFNLDEAANHQIDGSFLYTQTQDDAVELQSGGYLPGFDYATVSQQQLVGDIDPQELNGIKTPGSFIGNLFRPESFGNPDRGALAFTTFNQSTSFETDRDFWVAQVNGDHEFAPLPGLHFNWAVNRAKTTQNESALGIGYFYEPCGYSQLVPCAPGTEPIDVPTEFPTSQADLGPGEYVVRDDFLLSANSIEETSSFYRLDADYEFEFSEAARFTVGGGTWFERADRTVDSGFLENPTVGASGDSEVCVPTATSGFPCLAETPLELGAAFNELGISDGNLAGIRETTSEASRGIDAWHLRGKFTFWDRLDFLGGVRGEKIDIQSRNDPFTRDPVTGEVLLVQGGPQMYPSRFLFFDRLDNPFQRPGPNGIVEELTDPPPDDFVFNDQLLGEGSPSGPCLGDDGSIPGIQCVDLVDEDQLEGLVNGNINERRLLPSAGFALRPFEGMILRGAWSQTVARPSFRELGYYVTVEPGTDDLVVGNPQLQLSDVESWDARAEYLFGERGDLIAVSYFKKKIDMPIEAIILRDPLNLELNGGTLYQTFFNNPNTADLRGIEAEARKAFDIADYFDALDPYVPDWLAFFSIGGNYTYIDAEVARTDVERARALPFYGYAEGDEVLFSELAPTRRLFNQPEWIANADLTFDHPEWGIKATVAYFAISDVLDAAGSATLGPDGSVLAYTPDRYVGAFNDLRATISKTIELPGAFGEITLRATGKNLTDSTRRLIYDTEQTSKEIAEQELRIGRDFSFSLTFKRRF